MTFLAPLDPLCWDRDLLRSLYGFDYVWEVYVPEARRRWGYYVLPLLFGDRLVGRIEPRIDRQTGTVTILRLWWEAGFDPRRADGFVPAMRAALADYLAFAEARHAHLGRPGRALGPPPLPAAPPPSGTRRLSRAGPVRGTRDRLPARQVGLGPGRARCMGAVSTSPGA